jgi:hypothetical protein
MGFQESWQLLQAQGTQVCRQREPWSLPQATRSPVAAASSGQPSLRVVGVLEPDCWPGLPGALLLAQGEPSLQAVGALGSASWHQLLGAMAVAAYLGEPSLQVVGILGPDC